MNKSFIFLLFSSLIFAQNSLIKRNLKGNVQSVNYSFDIVSKSIDHDDCKNVIKNINPFYNTTNASIFLFENKDIVILNSFEEFNKNGFLIKYKPIHDLEDAYSIQNKQIELIYKELQSEIKNFNFPQYPSYLSFIPIEKPYTFFIKEMDKTYDFNPNFTNFTIHNDKIVALKQYDTIKYSEVEILENNVINTKFIYDVQGKIIRKEIIIKDDLELSEDKYISEVYKYFYDEKNRINRFQMFRNNKFELQEIYNLDKKGNLISIEKHQKVDIYAFGNLFSNKAIFYFDKFNNINKIDFYDNDFGIQLLNSFQFEYEYDKNKNWIVSKMFLNNQPIAVFNRTIVYY